MHSVWRLSVCALLAAVLASRAWGADSKTTRVTVQCTEPKLVAGLELRVLKPGPKATLRPTEDRATFDAQGEATVSLAPGSYVFEALAARKDGTVIAIHSGPAPVPRSTPVKINAGDPQPVTLRHEDKEVKITEVALRSAATVDDVRWRRTTPGVSPRVILTPGETARINVIGNTDALYIAAWEKARADKPVEVCTQKQWNTLSFAKRAGTPTMRSATAILAFPDARMEIPITDATRVSTNRRYLMIGYRVELADRKSLEFEPRPYLINRLQQFDFGGAELTPHAWAAYVPEFRGDKHVQHLLWRYDLLDPGGQRLNVRGANCGAAATATRRDGKPLPNGAVDEKEQTAIGDLGRGVRVKVNWTWNGSQSRELSPVGFAPLRSEHFQLQAVPAWTWHSQNYLSMFEHLYTLEREVTGRPGPALAHILWRTNRGGLATVGRSTGGQDLRICLSLHGYEEKSDPLDRARFSSHELLHSFGYHHRNEAERAVIHDLNVEVVAEFLRYRWYLVDHPDVLPLMVQVGPADAAQKPKAKKEKTPTHKKGHKKR